MLTTYETLASRIERNGPFWRAKKWRRVIFDEAHCLRNRLGKQSQALLGCLGPNAERKWCLTGTPFVNDMADFFPLIKFLQLQPFWQLGQP